MKTQALLLPHLLLLLLLSQGLSGCGGEDNSGVETRIFANRVIEYSPMVAEGISEADWPYFFNPEAALGPPGDVFEVVSLGYDPSATNSRGGSLLLGLGNQGGAGAEPEKHFCFEDGAGADLAVYENPFVITDPDTGEQGTNNEVATLAVSSDGVSWYEFPPALDQGKALTDPERYTNLAGITPASDGGDLFDLAEIISLYGLDPAYQPCYLLITDGGTLFPDYGNSQTDQFLSGADINAVEVFRPVQSSNQTP